MGRGHLGLLERRLVHGWRRGPNLGHLSLHGAVARSQQLRVGFKEEKPSGKGGNGVLISWDLGKGRASRLISQNGNPNFPRSLEHLPPTRDRCPGIREGQSLSSHCASSGWQVPSISQTNSPDPRGPPCEQACRPRQTATPPPPTPRQTGVRGRGVTVVTSCSTLSGLGQVGPCWLHHSPVGQGDPLPGSGQLRPQQAPAGLALEQVAGYWPQQAQPGPGLGGLVPSPLESRRLSTGLAGGS